MRIEGMYARLELLVAKMKEEVRVVNQVFLI